MKTDVHQHLWSERLFGLLAARARPPLVRRTGGEWVLRLGRLRPTRRGRLALGYVARGKSEIALLEFSKRSISIDRGSRLLGD